MNPRLEIVGGFSLKIFITQNIMVLIHKQEIKFLKAGRPETLSVGSPEHPKRIHRITKSQGTDEGSFKTAVIRIPQTRLNFKPQKRLVFPDGKKSCIRYVLIISGQALPAVLFVVHIVTELVVEQARLPVVLEEQT